MGSSFPLAIKSTLDYHVNNLAVAMGYPYVDMDSPKFYEALVQSQAPALGWDLGQLDEEPSDPLWSIAFTVGVFTDADPAHYVSMDAIGRINDVFFPGADFDIMDYSQAIMPTVRLGFLTITTAEMQPYQSDNAMGLRVLALTGRVARIA